MGLTATDLMKIEKASASTGGLPVIWIAGQACTGCTVSLLNSVYYQTIEELVLLGQASTTLDIKVLETVMGAMSNEGTQQAGLTDAAFALVVEGAIPQDANTAHAPKEGYCTIGSYTGATSENVGDVVTYLAGHSNCAAILTVGTCSSYGGIPAAAGNVTGASGVLTYLGPNNLDGNGHRFRSKTICIPGCPPNPNWIVGTIAYLLANGLSMPALDSLRRPRTYYGERICNSCDRFATSLTGQFVGFVGMDADNSASALRVTQPEKIGDIGQNAPGLRCLKKAGCKGSRTKSDCSMRKWHSPGFMQAGVNWCVGAGAPCQGCVQNYFPDRMSPFHYIK